MKKILSVLLVVLMLASLSVCAFAGDSPSQDPGDPGVVVVPTDKDKEKAEAEKAEAEATKTIDEAKTTAEDENGEDAVVALGKLPANATAEMKADFKDLEDTLVDAKKALANIGAAAIPVEVTAEVGEDVKVEAGQAFRAVANEYPVTITIAVENPKDFVGMMVFVNGKWVKLNTIVNDDGTVTFVLDQPAVLSIVSQIVEAA
jgi:autonomous glycyl radical cofactor GrcA